MKGFTISKIVEKAVNPEYPVIVEFQNGTLVSKKGSSLTINVTEVGPKRKKVMISDGMSKCYEGHENSIVGNRLFLIALKKGSKEAKMIEVGTASLLNSVHMKYRVPVQENVDKIEKMYRMFAGKQKLRRIDQWEKVKLDASTVEETLKESLASLNDTHEVVSVQLKVNSFDILPPCNKEATDVRNVFSMDDMFGPSLMANCREKFRELFSTDLKGFRNVLESSYTINLWEKSKESINVEENAFIISIIDSLLKFKRMITWQLKHQSCSFYKPLHDRFLELFTEQVNHDIYRNFRHRDKIFCYILALNFLVGNCIVNMRALSVELKITHIRLCRLCRTLGGTSKIDGFFELKVPLSVHKN